MSGARIAVPGRAIIRAAVAPMYLEPFVRSTQISQRLSGHGVDVLERQDDWFRVRGDDAYEGWVHWGFLSPANGGSPASRVSFGCRTRNAAGERRALPLGARLAPDEVVTDGEAMDERDLAARFPRTADAIVHSATTLFAGAPYLWGGITPWGADCSGFAQTVFGLHGVMLPRDAWQQSEAGVDAGALDELRPADLAFFSDREDQRVTHVAVSLGARRLAHLALGRGGFALESLEDDRDDYVRTLRQRFLRARRVL